MASLTIAMDAGEVFIYVDQVSNSSYRLTIDDDSGTTIIISGTYNQIESVKDRLATKLADVKHS